MPRCIPTLIALYTLGASTTHAADAATQSTGRPRSAAPRRDSTATPILVPAPPRAEGRATPSGLVFLTPAKQDFGVVLQGKDVVRTFRVKNTLPGPVELSLADVSCNCTSVRVNGVETRLPDRPAVELPAGLANLPPLVPLPEVRLPPPGIVPEPATIPPMTTPITIAAGATAGIEVCLRTANSLDRVEQFVAFRVSSSDTPLKLELVGTVLPTVEVFPPIVEVKGVSSDRPGTLSFVVSSRAFNTLTVGSVQASSQSVRVQVRPLSEARARVLGAKAACEVHVHLDAGIPVGLFNESITLNADFGQKRALVVPLIGRIDGPVKFLGVDVLELSAPSGNETRSAAVVARLHSGETVRVIKVESNTATVHATASIVRSGDQQHVLIVEAERASPQNRSPIPHTASIVVETDHPQVRKIRIPVTDDAFPEGSVVHSR